MPLLLSMDHTALSMALPLNAPSSFIMPLPSPSDSYFVLPGYQTQIPSCLCAFVYAVPSPRLPFPTFFAKTPPTHSLWLCVDTASSSNCSLVTPGGPFCTWGHPPPSMLAFASPCWNRPRLSLLALRRVRSSLVTNDLESSVTQCSVLISGGFRGWSPAELSWEHWLLLINWVNNRSKPHNEKIIKKRAASDPLDFWV